MLNYIDQINLLHRIRRKDSLEPIAVALHVILLDICNSDDWENPFSLKNDRILSDLNVSFKTLAANRNKLQQSGLIRFKTKNGSSECIYKILTPEQSKEFRTSGNITKVRDEVWDEVTTEVRDGVKGAVDDVYNTGIIKPKPKPKQKPNAEAKPPLNDEEKDSGKKPEPKEPALFQACMKIYCDWFQSKFNIGPKIDSLQGKALKDLIQYFRTQVLKRAEADQLTLDEPEIENRIKQSMQLVLDGWDKLEEFYQKQTKLNQIASNIQNIIVQIKRNHNGNNNKTSGGQPTKVPLWRK